MKRPNLENASHIAFILACGALIALALTKFSASSSMPPATEQALRGHTLPRALLGDVGFGPQTILIFVSSTCRYCNDSMPFYQRLETKVSAHMGRVRLVFASREPVEITQRYLRLHGVESEAISILGNTVPLSGTPTLLLADDQGVVKHGWLGRLTSDQEEMVLKIVARGN